MKTSREARHLAASIWPGFYENTPGVAPWVEDGDHKRIVAMTSRRPFPSWPNEMARAAEIITLAIAEAERRGAELAKPKGEM